MCVQTEKWVWWDLQNPIAQCSHTLTLAHKLKLSVTFLNKSDYQCSPRLCDRYLWICNTSQPYLKPEIPFHFVTALCVSFFLSFLPICLYPLNRLKDTHMRNLCDTHTHTLSYTCRHILLLASSNNIEGKEGLEGVKWHCSLNDPEQISLSRRQTAPKPFRIKLGHAQRERERQTGGEKRENRQMGMDKSWA